MHVEDEIIPALDAGRIVVTDRYVQSSLVLQRVDAVDLREIWSYDRYVLQPAISLYLVDDPQVIAARRRLTRLEATGNPVTRIAALPAGVRLPRPPVVASGDDRLPRRRTSCGAATLDDLHLDPRPASTPP